ncbi:MAG: protein adenylyltransferase SelO family protein, partial [Phenylobacterium sp.]|uniref:protein adenylyltransferase SelO family protein n=1 Tax=Phenylobacterium sp. TaxID=1871053 RepID=UPI002734AB5F
EAVFWNLQQLAGCLTLVASQDALVEALNGFAEAYRRELAGAVRERLGLAPGEPQAEADLANAAFRALAAGGADLRWEPLFFDWFCGDQARALAGPRATLYAKEEFADFRAKLADFTPERPERLSAPCFAAAEPQELIYEEIETIWAGIAQDDDWGAFLAKLAAIETARTGYGLTP